MTEEQKKALFTFCKAVEQLICGTQEDCENCYKYALMCPKYLLMELRDSLGLENEIF